MTREELVALRLALNEAEVRLNYLSMRNTAGLNAQQQAELDVDYALAADAVAMARVNYQTAIVNFRKAGG